MTSSHVQVFATGLGAYTVYGAGVDCLWQNLLAQTSVIQPIPTHWTDRHRYVSQVYVPLPPLNPTQWGYKKMDLLQYDPVTLMAMIGVAEALQQAGLSERLSAKDGSIHPHRIGVFMGTGIGGVTTTLANAYHHFKEKSSQSSSTNIPLLFPHVTEANRLTVPRQMPNAIAAAIAIRYGIHGPVKTYCQACASGTVALGEAYRALRNGQLDMAIVGGAEMLGDDVGACFRAFDRMGALTSAANPIDQSCKPFDQQRDGFLFSEGGAGILLLETADCLQQRQQWGDSVKPLAEIVAYAESFDAYHLVIPDPSGRELIHLIQQGLTEAGLTAQAIQYINAHGTGTEKNDAVESQVITQLFGDKVVVNSTKGWMGHAIGASGAIEAIVTIQSLLDQQVHGNAHLQQPIAPFILPTQNYSLTCRHAISQSFAFGGHNALLIFKAS